MTVVTPKELHEIFLNHNGYYAQAKALNELIKNKLRKCRVSSDDHDIIINTDRPDHMMYYYLEAYDART